MGALQHRPGSVYNTNRNIRTRLNSSGEFAAFSLIISKETSFKF
jgi:hypothetical protein